MSVQLNSAMTVEWWRGVTRITKHVHTYCVEHKKKFCLFPPVAHFLSISLFDTGLRHFFQLSVVSHSLTDETCMSLVLLVYSSSSFVDFFSILFLQMSVTFRFSVQSLFFNARSVTTAQIPFLFCCCSIVLWFHYHHYVPYHPPLSSPYFV